MKKKRPQAEIKITVRLPADVHVGLVHAAKDHDRSLNSELVHLAKLYLASLPQEKQESKGLGAYLSAALVPNA